LSESCTPTRAQAALIALTRSTFLKGGITRKAMAGLVRAAGPGVIDTGFRGARFRVHLGDNLTERNLLLDPRTEREELDFLIAATPPGGVFVDCGANVGLYALVTAAARPAAQVIAIEPDPLIRERLQTNLALCGFANVTLCPEAVGDSEGEIAFIRDTGNLGESHVAAEGGLTVPVRPLAAILRDAGIAAVDSLKIDVEGYEDRALAPFFRDWPQEGWPRALVIEHVHPDKWRTDCMALLRNLGYRPEATTEYNTLLRRE
jgi:FkbM family methyltransferase